MKGSTRKRIFYEGVDEKANVLWRGRRESKCSVKGSMKKRMFCEGVDEKANIL